MELWIRSQDRTKLTKAQDLSYIGDRNQIISYNLDTSTYLGFYKNKERALEVLDEIQELLMPIITIDHTVKPVMDIRATMQTYEVDESHMTVQSYKTYVYEMPEE
jgi:hypothetical protein